MPETLDDLRAAETEARGAVFVAMSLFRHSQTGVGVALAGDKVQAKLDAYRDAIEKRVRAEPAVLELLEAAEVVDAWFEQHYVTTGWPDDHPLPVMIRGIRAAIAGAREVLDG